MQLVLFGAGKSWLLTHHMTGIALSNHHHHPPHHHRSAFRPSARGGGAGFLGGSAGGVGVKKLGSTTPTAFAFVQSRGFHTAPSPIIAIPVLVDSDRERCRRKRRAARPRPAQNVSAGSKRSRSNSSLTLRPLSLELTTRLVFPRMALQSLPGTKSTPSLSILCQTATTGLSARVVSVCAPPLPDLGANPVLRSENSSSETKTLKRSAPDSAELQLVSQNGQLEEIEDGLKVWGYMPGHVHYKVGAAEEVRSPGSTCMFSASNPLASEACAAEGITARSTCSRCCREGFAFCSSQVHNRWVQQPMQLHTANSK